MAALSAQVEGLLKSPPSPPKPRPTKPASGPDPDDVLGRLEGALADLAADVKKILGPPPPAPPSAPKPPWPYR